jgi:hypothetical protein
LDEVLASRNARSFFHYAISSHSARLEPVVDRMERSDVPAVAQQGALWSTLIWLYEGRRQKAFEESVHGSVARRLGAASALVGQVTSESVAAKCQAWLTQFFDDPERGVRVAGTAFLDIDLDFQAPGMITLLRAYVGSKAYLADPKRLLWALREFKGDFRPLSQLVFDICDRLTDRANATLEEASDRWGFAMEELSMLLLRLYGQVEPPHDDPVLRKECLDRLDKILRAGNGSLPSVISLLES